MREVDGMLVAFIDHDSYFGSFSRETSLVGVSRDTGAMAVFILAPGKTEADVSDADVRQWLTGLTTQQPEGGDEL